MTLLNSPRLAPLALLGFVAGGSALFAADWGDVEWKAKQERVPDFAALVPEAAPGAGRVALALERVSTAVPWPRGLAFVDDELVVLARGRHRRAGGVDHAVEDLTGSLFVVDASASEPVVPGALASDAVKTNARPFAAPDPDVFYLPDRSLDPVDDFHMDRPYCTLAYDAASDNLFLCGFSGVDLPGSKFRKNATDSIHRFDRRVDRWFPVEMHDAAVVPAGELTVVAPNQYYPHHDPSENAAPHGWLNGPDGCTVAGSYLYVLAKDNHLVVQYDLDEIRADPAAGAPESRPVLGPGVRVRHPEGEAQLELLGPSAAVVHDEWLYVGYRTSSVVVRYRLDARGDLVGPPVGELIAVFEPWDAEKKRSANLIDLAFDSKGALYASCAKEGRIWRIGVPDPSRPFYGNDQDERPTSAPPYVDLRGFTGKKTNCGNIVFDDRDRLYLCSGNYDTDSRELAGVIYRALPAR